MIWPLFGVVTLLVASIYAGIRGYRGRWASLPATWPGGWRRPATSAPATPIAYRLNMLGSSNGLKCMQLGVDTVSVLDFECKHESRIDRFFKWTGLSVEQQLGRDDFDRSVYLVSDDRRMLEALHDDPRIAELLMSFFATRPHPDYRTLRLVCRGGSLRVDLREASYLPARMSDMYDQVLPRLKELSERLPTRILLGDRRRDWLGLRAIAVLALSTGLAINGGVQLFRLLLFGGSITLAPSQLLAWTLPVGAALLGLMVLATTVLLARSSRLHLVMFEVLLVGLFGAFATAFVEVRDLNMAMDRSEPTTMRSTVVDRYSTKSRRAPRRFYLVLSDWPVAGDRKARVDRGTYYSVEEGDPVVLYLRKGWLDIPWVDRIEKSRGETTSTP